MAVAALLIVGGATPNDTSPNGAPNGARQRTDRRTLSASDIRIDVSSARGVLALWPADPKADLNTRRLTRAQRTAALELATGPAYRTLRAFQSEQNRCFISDEEMQRALLYPDSLICGISLSRAYAARGPLDSLLTEIQQREGALREAIAVDAGHYLPPRGAWQPVRIWVVLGSQWSFDAVTLAEGGEGPPAVVVNAMGVLDYAGSARDRVDVLEHVLAHEVFHAGVRQIGVDAPGWARYMPRARTAYGHLARVLLDEGVAHYVDWKRRSGADTLFIARPGLREKDAFFLLAEAVKRLASRSGDSSSRIELLQLASTGPLWDKYGAISGMFMSYRIESRLGADSLRAAVVGGPREFIRMYGSVAARDTALARVPEELSR